MAGQSCLSLLILLCLCAIAPAENWPRFRGPNGAGIVAKPFAAGLTESDIAWKQPLPGVGHSSPVVWDGHVYVTSADPEEGQRFVVCLSAESGKELWRNTGKFNTYRKHRDNSFASSTPAADDLGVYAAFTTPQEFTLLALGHDGKERWKASLGRFDSTHGGGASPMLVGELVVVNFDQESGTSALRAFDRKTGKEVWSLPHRTTGKAAMSTPTVWKPADGDEQIVFSTWGGGVQGVNPKTGKMLWSAPDVFFSRPVGSPQVTKELVVAVCGEGNGTRALVTLRPDPTGVKPPAPVYKIDQLGPHVPTPLIAGDRLVMLNDLGLLTVADLSTGKTRWSQKAGPGFYGSPILAGDVLWAVTKSGTLVGVRLEADAGKEVCNLDLNAGVCHTTPAIADGRMFVRTASTVICLRSRPPA